MECYVRSVTEFDKHFNKPPDRLGPEEIRSWQLFLLNEKGVKLSSYIQAVRRLRFFYSNTLNRKIEIERIPLPKYEKKLPDHPEQGRGQGVAGSPEESRTQGDPGHMYGAGLRVSKRPT